MNRARVHDSEMCGRLFAAWAVAMSAAVVQATAEPDWPDCDQVNESISVHYASNSPDIQATVPLIVPIPIARPTLLSRRRYYNDRLRARSMRYGHRPLLKAMLAHRYDVRS